MATSPQSPPVSDVVSLAVSLHQGGHFSEAEELYQRALERDPNHIDALHFLGVLRHQQGDSEEAVRLIRRALLGNPAYHGARNNLGNVLKESERFDEAEAEYRRVIQAAPGHADAHNNLGAVLRALKRTDEAIESFRRAIEAQPRHADAHLNLGNALKASGQREESLTAFRTAVEINPRHSTAHLSLGRALYVYGRADEAVVVYRSWLKIDPDNPIAKHMLAACEGNEVPDRCSEDYVRQSFDAFAASFDEVLERLDYRAPALIADALSDLIPHPPGNLHVLDAGCGTGLCGEDLRPYAERLVGIDLSPKMMVKARSRNVYDQLVETELVAYMSGRPDTFDLIVSADTLIYFGDLEHAIATAAEALRPGGALVFTVECLEQSESAPRYQLNPHGRYSHRQDYLCDCIAAASLRLHEIRSVVLRREVRQPVAGLVVTALKES
ncbi:TPR repeat-containing protein YrrB [Stieleria maiorica]|uniref:TPR repeat-containing protein YrrB n=1 Tax=Stieleria maiorica TaxID=2795974 RepID=A0A5B9MNZ3_9BACT|nr:tetratricopeptide repeat protein [Stieleria maiorica]QEG01405.1 TPR repeat-containing protein YrrB [Stieleria maiorica]